MNPLPFLLGLGLLWLGGLKAQQNFLGYHSSRYAGVSGIYGNPTAIVDAPFFLDINLFSTDFNLSNNYLRWDRQLFRLGAGPWADSSYNNRFQDFRRDYLRERDRSQARFHQSFLVQGPSVALRLGKHSFALSTALRQQWYMDNLDRRMADFILEELRDPSQWNILFENKRFNTLMAAWSELAFTYGREVYSQGPHRIQAAVQPKFALAAASAYFYADQLDLIFRNNDTLDVQISDIRFGYSNNLRDSQLLQRPLARNIFNRGSLALDLGLAYEWRPDEGEEASQGHTPYKARVALGLHDLGFLRFDRGNFGGNFAGTAQSWDLNNIDVQGIESFGRLMQDSFNMTSNRDPYRLRLPTSFSLQVDYRVWKAFYVQFSGLLAFSQNDAPLRLHALNQFSLCPRFEHRWFDVALPLSLDGYGNFRSGLSARLGPLFLGSANLLNFISGRYVHGLQGFMGLKIPIYRKNKEAD